jgi:hypothetical protein
MFDRAKFWRYSRYTVLTVALLAAAFTLFLDFRVRSEFEGRRFALPARIYARPLELHAGLRIAQIDVVRELQEAGYSQGPREGDPGWFANDNDWLEVAVRPFVFWDGMQPAKRVRVAFDSGAVKAVLDAEGKELPLARLEPLAIGGIYTANNEDRVLVRLSEAHGAGADRERGPQFLLAPRFRPARHRPRCALLFPRPRAPGRKHADAAAGEEFFPHPRAHADAQGHRALHVDPVGNSLR